MMVFQTRRGILSCILIFYLAAQVVQQYVLRFGPLSAVEGMEEAIVAGQHPLNFVPLFLVLLSMYLLVAAYLIIGLAFYERNPLLSILSIIFFIFFCGLEIGYRSVELFQVVEV